MYKENMKIISKFFKDQKELPLDRALWWIEWAIRNPSPVNRGKNFNFVQIQSIDVISVLTMLTLTLFYIVMIFLKKIFLFIFSQKKVTNKDKND